MMPCWPYSEIAPAPRLARRTRAIHSLKHPSTEWAPSFFYRHVDLGNYPADWADHRPDDGRDYGEL